MDDELRWVPAEAFDSFVDGLDAKELVEIIKMNGPLADKVFLGFRPSAQAIKAPVVRQRIAREFDSSLPFRTVLLEFWSDLNAPILDVLSDMTQQQITRELPKIARAIGGLNLYLALLFDGRKGLEKLAEKRGQELIQIRPDPLDPQEELLPEPDEPHAPDPLEKTSNDLRLARNKAAELAKKNRELEKRTKSLEKSVEKWGRKYERLIAELERKGQQQSQAQRRVEQAERERDRAAQHAEELERQLHHARKALDAKPEPQQKQPPAPWETAVEELLKSGNNQSAVDFLSKLTERSGEDPRPHELLARAYRQARQPEQQKEELLWLGRHYLSSGSLLAAADRLSKTLALDPASTAARSMLRSVFNRTDQKNEKRMSGLRRLLFRLQQTQPEIREQVLSLAESVSPPLARALDSVPAGAQIDKLFKLQHDGSVRQISPRQMIDAINRNDVEAVRFLKDALAVLREKSSQSYEAVERGIRAHDSSCWFTLVAVTQPVVVDASNAAHSLPSTDGKPRLRNITVLRQELRRRCHFPVYIFADAALLHQIDQQAELLRMVESGELEFAEPRTDADKAILDLAKQLKCPVVSRDRMLDWDPTGEVPKIRFEMNEDGAVVFA